MPVPSSAAATTPSFANAAIFRPNFMAIYMAFAGITAAAILLAVTPMVAAQDRGRPLLSRAQSKVAQTIDSTITRAGEQFRRGDFDGCGETLTKAIDQVRVAMDVQSPELYDAIEPSIDRIIVARAKLDLEGVTLSPFRKPDRPSPSTVAGPTTASNSNPMPNGPSFVTDVAPILVAKCGQCHINGNRGGFSMQTFADLMKGPPEGVVVFPGDVVASRLIETIETGDMPRGGGRVSPRELAKLKEWVLAGASFDGNDSATTLTALSRSTNGSPNPVTPDRATPKVTPTGEPTGGETVQFARDVAPLLVANCSGCHIDAMQQRGGLNMNTLAQLFRGGDSGDVVTPGRGESSLLVQKLRGTVGDRMPAGGRPPLPEEAITLISTWISEGAKVTAADRDLPLTTVTQQAWLQQAGPEQITARRQEIATQNVRLAGGDPGRLAESTTDHFRIIGEVSPATLELVAAASRSAIQTAAKLMPDELDGADGSNWFAGLATIHVFPRRYDYSEFAKMVEQRDVPANWLSHWHSDGLTAYVAMVVTPQDDADAITSRMVAPIVSLSVASRGPDVPRWFAEGLGQSIALRESGADRGTRAAQIAEVLTAVGSLQNGQAFFEGKLPPGRADRLAAAVCESLIDAKRRRSFDMILRSLQSGQPFEAAFTSALNVSPAAYFDAWLGYVRR